MNEDCCYRDSVAFAAASACRSRDEVTFAVIVAERSPEEAEGGEPRQVAAASLDLLAKLFPHKKRSVLELVLRRCGDDLVKAIEQCVPRDTK